MICIHADQVIIYNTDEKADCGCKDNNGNSGNNGNGNSSNATVASSTTVQNGLKEIG